MIKAGYNRTNWGRNGDHSENVGVDSWSSISSDLCSGFETHSLHYNHSVNGRNSCLRTHHLNSVSFDARADKNRAGSVMSKWYLSMQCELLSVVPPSAGASKRSKKAAEIEVVYKYTPRFFPTASASTQTCNVSVLMLRLQSRTMKSEPCKVQRKDPFSSSTAPKRAEHPVHRDLLIHS